MRFVILSIMLITTLFADSESVDFFKESKDNELLCHVANFSYKVISQKDATVVKIHDHIFFKLKSENLYLLNNACHPITDKKDAIIF